MHPGEMREDDPVRVIANIRRTVDIRQYAHV